MKKAPLFFILLLLCSGSARAQTTALPASAVLPSSGVGAETSNVAAEPHVKATTAENASATTPENVKAPTVESVKAPTVENVKASAPESAGVKSATAKKSLVLPREKANPLTLTRFETAPLIDGEINEDVWRAAAVLSDFYQIAPGDHTMPTHATEVLLGYDSRFLYIAFRAHDEPGKVRSTVAKRDAVFEDDTVRVFLDTFNDKRRAYMLVFNPLGVQADAIYTEGRGEDLSMDIVMESKGVLHKGGYTVEVAIPFNSLRYEVGKDKLWGVHFLRKIRRLNNETDSWMPISRDKSGVLNQAGHIVVPEHISNEHTLEIIPSLTLSEAGRRVRSVTPALAPNGRLVNDPINVDPGLTMKFGITPNVTLDFALNPDFAQVEADQTVVTANQRFPIFFEEKRPFFLEGIDIFQTPLNAVHTRSIVDPDYALKLTGKQGRNTFGVIYASDNAPGNFNNDERLDPRNFRFLDKNSHIGVARLKRDVGRESSIGVIATTYNFIEKHNHTGGFDGRLRLDPQSVFSFQALGTTSKQFFFDPQLGQNVYRTGNGFGYSWNYERVGRNMTYALSGEGRTSDYRAEVGFTQRTNTNRTRGVISYSSEPQPTANIISWKAFNAVSLSYDWQGRSQGWNNESQLAVTLQRQTSLGIGVTGGYERLFEEEFGARRTLTRRGRFAGDDPERSTPRKGIFVFGSTTPSPKYSINFFAGYNTGVFDLNQGAGRRFPRVSPGALINSRAALDPGPGDALSIQSSFVVQPTTALRLSLDYRKSSLVREDTGRTAFDDNIYSFRGSYQFTRFTFARARIDYSTLALRARGQFLLGWSPNPGTSFYVGYNDDLNRNGFNPFTGLPEDGYSRNGRTFFIKMSYLFQRSF